MSVNLCDICGEPIKRGEDAFELTDGKICKDCVDDLRVMYPVICAARGNYKRIDISKLEECRGLKDAQIKILRKYLKKNNDSFIVDIMHILSLEEFKEKLDKADAYEENIRMRYYDYTNICTVDFVRPLGVLTAGDVGIQHVRGWRNCWCISGYIKAGRFHTGEMVTILHGDRKINADIKLLTYDFNGSPTEKYPDETRTTGAEGAVKNKSGKICIAAGYPVMMILNYKASEIMPGDLIVLD